MSRLPVSRDAVARSHFAAASGQAWAGRAPSSLRLVIVLLFACVVTPVLLTTDEEG